MNFDCPGVWQDFFTSSVIVRSVRGVAAFRASVLLNQRETSQTGGRFGDVYSVVCSAEHGTENAWPLCSPPTKGDIFEVDDGSLKLYVFSCHKIDSCYHIMAMTRNAR